MTSIVASSVNSEQAADMMDVAGVQKQIQIGDITLTWMGQQGSEGARVLVQGNSEEAALLQLA